MTASLKNVSPSPRRYDNTLRPMCEIAEDEWLEATKRAVNARLISLFARSGIGMTADDMVQEARLFVLKYIKDHPDALMNFPRIVQLCRFRLIDTLRWKTYSRSVHHDDYVKSWRFNKPLQGKMNSDDVDNEFYVRNESVNRSDAARRELNTKLAFKDIIAVYRPSPEEKTMILGHFYYGFDMKTCGEIVGYKQSNTSLKYERIRARFKELCPTPEVFREKFIHE